MEFLLWTAPIIVTLPPPECTDGVFARDKLPCTRAFVSILVALTKKHHMARDHNYQASDQHDVDHYTSAAIAGCLVTSDRAFRSTAGLITWRSFPVIETEEFLSRVGRM